MASMKAALLFASAVAVVANNQEFDVNDKVSLLQATVETQARSHKTVAQAEDDSAVGDYSLAADLKCTSDKGVEATPTSVEPRPLALADTISSKTTLEDPPGAAALRLALQSMIVLLVLDGIRRSLQLRLEETSKPGVSTSGQPQPQNLLEKESAWVAVVNAARIGDEVNFNNALAKEVPLTRVDAWGCTALHFAAVGGSDAIAKELLQRGCQVDALDAVDETPLHIAARAGHASMCQLFLGAGATIDAVSKDGLTPLAAAGFANQDQTCRVLTNCGAGVAGLSDEALPTVIVKHIVERMMAA